MKKSKLFLMILSFLSFYFANAQTIDRGGTGCTDDFCIWGVGSEFGDKAVVSIFEDSAANVLISRYSKNEMNLADTFFSIKLATPYEIDRLEKRGLFVRVLNTNTNKFSNVFHIVRTAAPSPVLKPGAVSPLSVGGTNFVVFDLGHFLTDPSSWGDPVHGVKMVLARYDEEKDLINSQIASMARSGQKRISLMLWYNIFPGNPGDVYMHTVNISNGLSLRHQNNLREVLEQIKLYSFESVTLRFGPQGNEAPYTWREWKEDNYLKQWTAITQAIDIVQASLSSTAIKTTYDLSAEGGGFDDPQSRAFTTRIWRDYVNRYGNDRSYGLSLAYAPGRLKSYVQDLDRAGVPRPKSYGLDIYNQKSMDGELYRLGKDLAELNEFSKEIVLQETYYNNGHVRHAVDTARAKYGLNITSINQWNLEQFWMGLHFSVLDPSKFNAYLGPIPAAPVVSRSIECTSGQTNCLRLMGSGFTRNSKFILTDGRGTGELLGTILPGSFTLQKVGKALYAEFTLSANIWNHMAQFGLTVVAREALDLQSPPKVVRLPSSK